MKFKTFCLHFEYILRHLQTTPQVLLRMTAGFNKDKNWKKVKTTPHASRPEIRT
ncbi:unnamed protein product [Arabidopsis halleri]